MLPVTLLLCIIVCTHSFVQLKPIARDGFAELRAQRFLSDSKQPFPQGGKQNQRTADHRTSSPQVRDDVWGQFVSKLEKEKPNRAFSKRPMQISSQSKPTRDELQCIHFKECSGCTIQSRFDNSPVMERARAFFKDIHPRQQEFPIHMGKIAGWRSQVKLAVQPMSKWGGLKFGLYRTNSHEVEAIPQCKVQHPRLNEAAETLRLLAIDAGVQGYVQSTERHPASGELRYVQLSLERSTNKVQLVLVWNAADYQSCSQALPRLVKQLKSTRPDLWHSVTINFNDNTGNNIFDYDPKKWKALWGPLYVKETVGHAQFYFRPQIFRQANLDGFEQLLKMVEEFVPVGSIVAELYSGLGLIGVNLAPRATAVYCSDSNAFVNEVFIQGADSLPNRIDSEKVFFECMDAESAVEQGQCDQADVVVVDPPRRGLNPKVLSYLTGTLPDKPLSNHIKRFIYVGCGFDAVERDIRELLSSKRWKIKAAEGFALFPGSDHLETVAVLDRM